ncbi:tRNA methylation protein TRM732 [Sporobolomyces salmoneus]|uniref:tRNA methylation protein TRM732 n=1 Tax=Sporobolomyces salmoneus TaxID=183962 RepID=UPI00316CDD14
MSTTTSEQGAQRTEAIFALRDRLVRDLKQAKKGKVGSKVSANGEADTSPLDYSAAFNLILEILSTPASALPSAAKGSGVPPTTLVAFEALEHLLKRSQSIIASASSSEIEVETVRNQLSTPLLVTLSTVLYTAWDIHPLSVQAKLKSCLILLLALASPSSLDIPEVSHQLKAKILADPWNNKRSLYSFEALLPHHDLEYFADFSVRPDVDLKEGIVRRIVEGILASEDMAPVAGRVGVSWVEKCWERQRKDGDDESSRFWIRPVLEACRLPGGAKARGNICIYFIAPICAKRPQAFRELLAEGGYLFERGEENVGQLGDEDLEAALAFLRVGNSLSLVQLDSATSTTNSSAKIDLPVSILETSLTRLSPSLRIDALSLLVTSSSNALPFPPSSLQLLRTFYTYSLGDEEGDVRMQTIGLTGKLLLRLRDSAWKAQRTANKGKDGAQEAQEYVESVKEWIEWWFELIVEKNLNPARPYRIKMNSLRMLDLAFQARIDSDYRLDSEGDSKKGGDGNKRDTTNGYSTYRKTASTQTPMFSVKSRPQVQKETKGDATLIVEEDPWPFKIRLATAETTQVLLRQLLSTYTSARAVCISTLERFPSPLPGYEGVEGNEKAKRELLLPALRMIRSGREADASAGAGILGLVWRKWVLDSVEKGDGSLANWTLGEVGGWVESEATKTGPPGFSFISSLLDLADHELSIYSSNLAQAASTIPMHGTILALRHLFISVPPSSYQTLSTPEELRALFRRALDTVKRVWEVTEPILAARGLEDPVEEGEADTEEARAIRIERSLANLELADDVEEDADLPEAEGMGGPQYRVILSACWRSIKEASELVETLLRLPSELGSTAFQAVWNYDEICEMGELFADWLRRIRHRGASMSLHPCYSRTAGVLLVAGKEWNEAGELPAKWLNHHLDSIVSSRISFTRRSAAIPYLLVGLLTTILPSSRSTFEAGFTRLFEIAESTSTDISDESRVHAMNTLRTAFLDAKCAGAIGPFVERAFLLSISLFWSTNWILRNVAMMLFASLITRAFNAKRTNLDRDYVSLGKRMTIDDFFGRYPNLKDVLREELARGWQQSLREAATSSLQSSIFAILMLFSLLQTPNPVESTTSDPIAALTEPIIPLVTACSASRVWKIRDAASDALTGLIAPSRVPEYCEKILLELERDHSTLDKNELHGKIGQILRLLRGVPPLSPEAEAPVANAYIRLATTLLSPSQSPDSSSFRPTQPFAVLSSFLLIALYLPSTLSSPLSPIYAFASSSLTQADAWSPSTYHVPSAEEFLRSCWQVLSKATTLLEYKLALVEAALQGRSIEVKREALAQLAILSEEDPSSINRIQHPLLTCLLSAHQAGDVRVAVAEILQSSTTTENKSFAEVESLNRNTTDVPLREALMSVLAGMARSEPERDSVLQMIERWSRISESVDSREASALALVTLRSSLDETPLSPAQEARFLLCAVRLLQDDDAETRDLAYKAARSKLVEGKAVEAIVRTGGDPLRSLILRDEELQFEEDLENLSNPSSLMFTIEKPNICRDDFLLPTISLSLSKRLDSEVVNRRSKALKNTIQTARGLESGPLGRDGNELVCRWVTPLEWELDLSGQQLVDA